MDISFSPHFTKYEELMAKADHAFEQVKNDFPDCVKCKIQCYDCCSALFDLALIEALYINYHFNRNFKEKEKDRVLNHANIADRKAYKLKRKTYNDLKSGKDQNEIMIQTAGERIRCPLLTDKNECALYEFRPITCRVYGIPTVIGGNGHTCGLSGFVEGKKYPSVNFDIIQKKLYDLSCELVKDINSKYSKLGEILVPVSTAILTVYDDEYLGIKMPEKQSLEKTGEDNV